jgi:hypothetical protein
MIMLGNPIITIKIVGLSGFNTTVTKCSNQYTFPNLTLPLLHIVPFVFLFAQVLHTMQLMLVIYTGVKVILEISL